MNGIVLPIRWPKPACRNGAERIPGQPAQRARVDAVGAEALAVDLVDDLDDPHHAEQQADHGGALEQRGAASRLHSAQCDRSRGPAPHTIQSIARVLIVALVLAALALAACGGGSAARCRRRPGAAGTVALAQPARTIPEVYADATRQRRSAPSCARAAGRQPLFALRAAVTARGSCSSRPRASARYVGRRVRVSGIFTVTFEMGYEILASRVTPVGSL